MQAACGLGVVGSWGAMTPRQPHPRYGSAAGGGGGSTLDTAPCEGGTRSLSLSLPHLCLCRRARVVGPPQRADPRVGLEVPRVLRSLLSRGGGRCLPPGPHRLERKGPSLVPSRPGVIWSMEPVMGEALPWWTNPCPRPSGSGVGNSGSESGPQSPGLVLIQDERGLELSP